METYRTLIVLAVNAMLSLFGFILSYRLINKLRDMFIKANLYGVDMNKRVSPNTGPDSETNSESKM